MNSPDTTADWGRGVDGAQLFLAFLEHVANRVLQLDRESLERLSELQGKVIRICFTEGARLNLPSEIYLLPAYSGLRLLSRHDGEVDVSLRGSPLTFIRLVQGGARQDLFASGELEISGDVELGRRFQRIVEDLDIDWEEQVSRVVGDVAAHRLGNLMRDARAWQSRSMQTLAADLAEYLQQETRMLAARTRVEAFLEAVDVLRADADRLQARVRRLQELC